MTVNEADELTGDVFTRLNGVPAGLQAVDVAVHGPSAIVPPFAPLTVIFPPMLSVSAFAVATSRPITPTVSRALVQLTLNFNCSSWGIAYSALTAEFIPRVLTLETSR